MTNTNQPVDKPAAAKRGRGRPPHVPTKALRDKVELCVAGGMTHDSIAVAVGVSRETLEKYYDAELTNGAARKRAEHLAMLSKAAKKGNASAIRQLLQLNPAGLEGLPLPPAPKPAAADKPAAPVGKKVEQQAAAEAAVADGPDGWGQLLQPTKGARLQ